MPHKNACELTSGPKNSFCSVRAEYGRGSSSSNTGRIKHLLDNQNFKLHYGDLTDSATLLNVISLTTPDEVYNLGAQYHVRVGFDMAEYTSQVDGLVRDVKIVRSN